MRETLKRFARTVVGHVIANVCLSMRSKSAVWQELRGRCGWGTRSGRQDPETRTISPRDSGRLAFVDGGG